MNDGGPAFPCIDSDEHGQPYYTNLGMSLLDWFAGMAMQGEIAGLGENDNWAPYMSSIAERSYHMASAMLAERERRMAK